MSPNSTVGFDSILLYVEKPALIELGRMASSIANYNFEWRYETLIIYNLAQIVITTFLHHYDKAVSIKKGKYYPKIRGLRPHVPQFVIFGADDVEISDILQWLSEHNYDNTAKYVIVCTSLNNDCGESMVFKTLAEVYMANVVFLKLTSDNEPIAYSYYPIKPGKCWIAEPERINLRNDCIQNNCFKNLFPDKFSNMHNCPLIVSTFEQPPYMYLNNGSQPSGGDGEIIKLVANVLNATLVIRTPLGGKDWGHFQDNNWTGSLGDVFNERAHVSMCSAPLTPAKFGNFQISYTYDSMDMVWAAALPAQKPSWEKLLYPLDYYIRLSLLMLFIGIILMNSFTKSYIWGRIRPALNIARPKTNLLFYSWTLFLGMPVQKIPFKTPLRTIVSIWLWFGVILRCLYQGALIGSLKVPAYQDNMESFKDVIRYKYPFGGLQPLREYFVENNQVYDNWKPLSITESYDLMDKMSDGKSDFVLASNKETIVEHLLKSGGSKQLQIIPEKIVNSPMVLYFKKNSHLTVPVNAVLTMTLEGGFSQRLYARYVSNVKLLFRRSTSQGPEPLRLRHFTGSIIVLVIGWMLAVIFFIVEYFCGKN